MATKKDKGAASVHELYTAGLSEINKVLAQGDADQRAVAMQAFEDLTAMMLAQTLETVQGRTALLAGLIAELTEVIDSVETSPPYANAVKGLTKILDGVRTRLAAEKKKLIPTDA